MTRNDFTDLPEWQKLVMSMQQMIDTCAEAALNEMDDISVVRYHKGFIDALRSVIDLPNVLLSDGNVKPRPETEKVVALPNHPKATRSPF